MDRNLGLKTTADLVSELTGNRPFVFVIIAYRDRGFVFEAVQRVVEESLGFSCIHAAMVEGAGLDLLQKIHSLVQRAELVIADISDSDRPNVFYELGYATALNKPVVLILQNGKKPPSDLIGLEVLLYSAHVSETRGFKQRLGDTLRQRLAPDTALLRDMLLPAAGQPAYVLCSPSYPVLDSLHDRKLHDEKTFGDYLGVVGLLSAFGRFYGERGYELISAQHYPPRLLEKPASLYLIGSPKSNPVTGLLLKRFAEIYTSVWSLNPVEGSDLTGDYPVELIRDQDGVRTVYPRMDETESDREMSSSSGERLVDSWDFGLIIRAPHPEIGNGDRLVLIMAGPRSVGTGAACLAATRSSLLQRVQARLPKGAQVADKSVAFWVLVKGTIRDRLRLLDDDNVEIVEAGLLVPKNQ